MAYPKELSQSLLLLSLLYFCIAQTDICLQQKDCKSCTSKSSGFFNCRWCISSKTCHSFSIISFNCASANDVVSSPFNCPETPSNRVLYYDTEGRKNLFLSATAYSATPAVCLQRHMPDTVLYSQYYVPCDYRNDTCLSFIAVSHAQRRVIISFRGTKNFEQLALEIINGAQGTFGALVDFPAGGRVLQYFSDAFFAIWNAGLQRDLAYLKLNYDDYQLWVVGHSLGGALASMTAALVTTKGLWFFPAIHLLTFGQPRVGDLAYSLVVEQNIAYRYRVVHEFDIVPHVPPEIPGGLVDSPFHHRYEVWYDNDMRHGSSFTVCLQAEDYHCSNGQIDVSVPDHLNYFGVRVGSYGEANCAGPFDFGISSAQ